MRTSRTFARLRSGPTAATGIIAATAVLFGLVPLFARQLQLQGMAGSAIAIFRYGIVALIMLPHFPWRRDTRREVLWLLGAGLITGLGWVGYLASLERIPVGAAGVIYMTYPLFALLLAWGLVGQRPCRRAFAACGLILLGAALVVDPSNLGGIEPLVLLAALGAPFSFGFAIVVLSSLTPSLTSLERVAILTLGGAMGLAPMLASEPIETWLPSGPTSWLLVIGLVLVTALVPQLLYTAAAPKAGAARSAAAGSMELPTMFVVGWLAFGEALGIREGLAALMVVAAVLIMPAQPARVEGVVKRLGTA